MVDSPYQLVCRISEPSTVAYHKKAEKTFRRFLSADAPVTFQVPKQWAQDVAQACEAKEAADELMVRHEKSTETSLT